MECKICYMEYPEYKFISAGCCSLKVCSECIKELEKCPQCKKQYFWVKIKDNDKSQLNINWQLEYQIMNLKYSLKLEEDESKKLSKKIIEQSKEIKELKEIISNGLSDMINYKVSIYNLKDKYNLL